MFGADNVWVLEHRPSAQVPNPCLELLVPPAQVFLAKWPLPPPPSPALVSHPASWGGVSLCASATASFGGRILPLLRHPILFRGWSFHNPGDHIMLWGRFLQPFRCHIMLCGQSLYQCWRYALTPPPPLWFQVRGVLSLVEDRKGI
ncbi:hypothetical protein DPEC_G00018770 [Dallia pectoralis]|uniref:Uncharacterized protein n=1 Tax=Dallia pectoralis TaxID=75939 RepID=A0ACC2HFJ3_DALPE|nr:hypothetical protein DPEC_G00018770 [Dallia pectoralis]